MVTKNHAKPQTAGRHRMASQQINTADNRTTAMALIVAGSDQLTTTGVGYQLANPVGQTKCWKYHASPTSTRASVGP